MQKPKESLSEIAISAKPVRIKESLTPNTKESASVTKKTKSLHPSIETYWQLQPIKERSRPTLSFMTLMFSKYKFRRSFRKMLNRRNIKLVIEGPHDPKDEKIVEFFRELLAAEDQLPVKRFDYHTLLRFLRMRDFDLVKAKVMFMHYLKWRKDFGVDRILKDFKFEEYEEVKKCYPHGFHGVDRYGRPVYIERIGIVDLDMFLQVTTVERFIKYHVSEQEKTLNWRYPACSVSSKKHIASTLSILDVKDVGSTFLSCCSIHDYSASASTQYNLTRDYLVRKYSGMAQFSKPARHLFMEIQKIDSNYYPETLHQLFIVNAGSKFRLLWKALKSFIDARTLAKIHVLGSDYKSRLLEVIDPSNLPSFLGGNCTCSEFGGGGCLFSDKGPWNDPQITQMLQGMFDAEEEHRGKDFSAGNYENNEDIFSSTNAFSGDKNVYDSLVPKIQALLPILQNANEKIGILETELEDTKLVLQGLAQCIAELKR